MLNFLKPKKNSTDSIKKHDIKTAVCALLLEVAHCDDEFTDDERALIIETVKNKFDLSKEEANQLIETAEKEREESVDLWHFTNQINENYSNDDKFELMEMLWEVVYADSKLDQHEDYILRIMHKLLRLDHRTMIAAKINAKSRVK